MDGANRRWRFALLHRSFEQAPSPALPRRRLKRPHPLVRAPRAMLGVQRQPSEIVSRGGAGASFESARASSSCRGWRDLHARFVFERAENAEAHFGERSAAGGRPDRPRDEFRQALRGPSREGDARARSLLDRRQYAPPRFACKLPILPVNGNSRSALAALRPRGWPAPFSLFLQRQQNPSETPTRASRPVW